MRTSGAPTSVVCQMRTQNTPPLVVTHYSDVMNKEPYDLVDELGRVTNFERGRLSFMRLVGDDCRPPGDKRYCFIA